MNVDLMSITLQIQGVAELAVHQLTGSEGMNTLFAFDLLISTPNASLDFDAIVGKACVLGFERGGEGRHLHGVVGALQQAETEERRTLYRVSVVPQVWPLSLGARYRILQGLTTGQILEKVLSERGVRHRVSLRSSYSPRDVCVQYGESDWAFLCRLMEEDGIFYFFEHTESATTLVIGDNGSVHEPVGTLPEIPYLPPTGGLTGGERVLSFRFGSRIRPGKVAVLDVPFETPNRRYEQEASFSRDTSIEVSAYPNSASARSALDALQVARTTAEGTARSVRLSPGSTFKLTGHPRPSFDVEYLIVRVDHALTGQGEEQTADASSFQCIPAGTLCRPSATTPKPRVTGPQAAQVVGPPGNEIHVDDKGRVLIKLEWDTSSDLSSACWVPVSQGSSGAGWGSMIIPRVGSYVLVEFLNGDPDRPIITGRVFNGVSPYPYKLPDDRSKTALRTHTTPGGGGYNELRFEDQSGSEQVYLRAQRNLDVEAQHDASRKVGHNDSLVVNGSRTSTVMLAETQSVGLAQTVTVGAAQTIHVVAQRMLSVGGDHKELVKSNHEQIVKGDHLEEVVGSWKRIIGGDGGETINGSLSAQVSGDVSASIGGSEMREVGGNHSMSVNGNRQEVVDGSVFLTHGALSMAISGDTALKGTGEVKLESEQAMKIGAPNVYVSGDSTIRIRAYDKIVLEVASSPSDKDSNAKIEITQDGIYLTHGSTRKQLTGDKIHLNT